MRGTRLALCAAGLGAGLGIAWACALYRRRYSYTSFEQRRDQQPAGSNDGSSSRAERKPGGEAVVGPRSAELPPQEPTGTHSPGGEGREGGEGLEPLHVSTEMAEEFAKPTERADGLPGPPEPEPPELPEPHGRVDAHATAAAADAQDSIDIDVDLSFGAIAHCPESFEPKLGAKIVLLNLSNNAIESIPDNAFLELLHCRELYLQSGP